MIEHIVHVFIILEMFLNASQGFLAQWQVVELVLEDDSRVIQTIGEQGVACLQLFSGEGDLCQIVFAFVRIVLGTVGYLLDGVFLYGCLRQGVTHLVGHFLCSLS